MTDDQVQSHMHRCLLRWICRASPGDRERFKETSNRVRGPEATEALRGIWTEMKKRGEV